MNVKFSDGQLETHTADIRRLIQTVDDEFVPPLTGGSRSDMDRSAAEGGHTDVDGYVNRCLARPLIYAVEDDRVVGFLSFKQIAESKFLDGYIPSNHVEIVAVEPASRGQGIASTLYEYLFTDLPTEWVQPYVTTKTWDGNEAHIALLEQFGFDLVHRIPNDRGADTDTVYFARETAL
jgi:ribosomal protein S18 acetylase RimI-like enzyme